MSNARGAKRAAFQKEYNARPENIKKRAANNAARAAYEKKHGDLPSNVDVGHKRALSAGGSNASSNLKAQSQKDNRGWRKGESGYKVKDAK